MDGFSLQCQKLLTSPTTPLDKHGGGGGGDGAACGGRLESCLAAAALLDN